MAEEKLVTRKSHRKSRQGCHNCKRRKVKCGEEKPTCVNCVRFSLSCEYGPSRTNAAPLRPAPPLPPPPAAANCVGGSDNNNNNSSSSGGGGGGGRRGRGRPRKDWAALYAGTQITAPDPDKPVYSRDVHPGNHPINITHMELLHHFVTQTGPSLTSSGHVDPMRLFWTENVPRIGLVHPVVMSLVFSLSAFHLASLHRGRSSNPVHHHNYRTTAEHHLGDGLRGMNRLMQTLNATTCGPAYVCATLVCYCTFAAGPTGPHDLLVVNNNPEDEANGAEPTPLTRWVPLVHGVRLIRESFNEEVLFSGLMAPLSPGRAGQPSRPGTAPSPAANDNGDDNDTKPPQGLNYDDDCEDSTPALTTTAIQKSSVPTEPSMYQENYPGLDWEGPVGELERHILQQIESSSSTSSPHSLSSPSTLSSTSPSSSSLPSLSVPAPLPPLPYPSPPSQLPSHFSSSASYKNTLRELHHLISILEATYGRDCGKTWTNVHPDNRFIFGWLYRMDAGFVECLRTRGTPEALVVLGFFAILIWVMEWDGRHWFMEGWARQILNGVRRGLAWGDRQKGMMDGDRERDREKMEEWLKWVERVVGKGPGEEGQRERDVEMGGVY